MIDPRFMFTREAMNHAETKKKPRRMRGGGGIEKYDDDDDLLPTRHRRGPQLIRAKHQL